MRGELRPVRRELAEQRTAAVVAGQENADEDSFFFLFETML
jgi:hypothetical protein